MKRIFLFLITNLAVVAVLSIVARPDFDAQGFQNWLAASKPAFPKSERPQVAELQSFQNLKNLLAKLEVLLRGQPEQSPNIKEAATAVENALKGAF